MFSFLYFSSLSLRQRIQITGSSHIHNTSICATYFEQETPRRKWNANFDGNTFIWFLLYLLVFSMSRNSVSFWYAFGNLKCFVYISMHGIFGNNTFLLRRRIMLAQTHIFFPLQIFLIIQVSVYARVFLSNANFFTCLRFLYSIELFAKNFKEQPTAKHSFITIFRINNINSTHKLHCLKMCTRYA